MDNLLKAFLRSDHAGEVGAVYIYRGILKIAKDPELVNFSKRHLKTEESHLQKIEAVLPKQKQISLVVESCWLFTRFSSYAIWSKNCLCYYRSC